MSWGLPYTVHIDQDGAQRVGCWRGYSTHNCSYISSSCMKVMSPTGRRVLRVICTAANNSLHISNTTWLRETRAWMRSWINALSKKKSPLRFINISSCQHDDMVNSWHPLFKRSDIQSLLWPFSSNDVLTQKQYFQFILSQRKQTSCFRIKHSCWTLASTVHRKLLQWWHDQVYIYYFTGWASVKVVLYCKILHANLPSYLHSHRRILLLNHTLLCHGDSNRKVQSLVFSFWTAAVPAALVSAKYSCRCRLTPYCTTNLEYTSQQAFYHTSDNHYFQN